MKQIKLKLKTCDGRRDMIVALAESGYSVKCVEEKQFGYPTDYYISIIVDDEEVMEGVDYE